MTPMSTRSTEARQQSGTSGVKPSASMWLRSMRHPVNARFAFAPIENTIGGTARLRESYSPTNLRSVSDIGASKADLGDDTKRAVCAEWSGPLHSVKPWRMEGVLGKPLGRRG